MSRVCHRKHLPDLEPLLFLMGSAIRRTPGPLCIPSEPEKMSVRGQIEHNRGVDFQGNLTWGMRQPPVGRTAVNRSRRSLAADGDVCVRTRAARCCTVHDQKFSLTAFCLSKICTATFAFFVHKGFQVRKGQYAQLTAQNATQSC